MLHPAFFTSAKVVQLPALDRLFFQGLWCAADRVGVVKGDSLTLRLTILPNDSDFDAEESLDRLAKAGLVVRYTNRGAQYAWLPGFTEHQKPHVREAHSGYPMADHAESQPLEITPRLALGAPRREKVAGVGVGVGVGVEVTATALSPKTGGPTQPALLPAEQPPVPAEKAPAELLRAAWNDAVAKTPLPSWQETPPKRTKLVAAAWKWKPDLAWWRNVFLAVAADPWARGEKPAPGHENWKASIDFVLRPEQATRFSEKGAPKPKNLRQRDGWGKPLPYPMTNDEFYAYQAEMKAKGITV